MVDPGFPPDRFLLLGFLIGALCAAICNPSRATPLEFLGDDLAAGRTAFFGVRKAFPDRLPTQLDAVHENFGENSSDLADSPAGLRFDTGVDLCRRNT